MSLTQINKQRLIARLIIAQPIIDMLTGQMASHLTTNVTIGTLFRIFLVGLLTIYLLNYFTQHHFIGLGIFLAILLICFISFIINWTTKQPFLLFQEAQFLFKTIYYVCITFMAYVFIKQKLLTKSLILWATQIAALIFSISYWLALITKTSFSSYSMTGAGYSGWFFATNELSVTILLLLGLTMAYLLDQKDSIKAWITFISILFISPLIGTKAAFFGSVMIFFVCLLMLLFTGDNRHRITSLIITILFCLLIPFTPITTNITSGHVVDTEDQSSQKLRSTEQLPVSLQRLLSSRDHYFLTIYTDYQQASMIRQIFGLGYAGDYSEQPKIIEMDFFDLFFSYGWLGTIFLLSPLLLITVQMISHIKRTGLTRQKMILAFVFCLVFAISFLAGHVIFAPSVITYVMLTVLATGLE